MKMNKESNKPLQWNFYREKDNHIYSSLNDFKNNNKNRNSLIISNSPQDYTTKMTDSATIIDGNHIQTFPISEIERIVKEGQKVISAGEISYNLPNNLFVKENLSEINSEELSMIMTKYGIEVKDTIPIKTRRGGTRIYKITSDEGEKFIFKYQGRDLNKFESQAEISREIDNFPKNIPLTGGKGFSINIGEDIYSLETFIEGDEFPGNKMEYFSKLGESIGEMHNDLNDISRRNSHLESILSRPGDSLNESNLISMHIDLENSIEKYPFLLNQVNELIKKETPKEIRLLPRQLIHGDLNKSNIIWNNKNPSMIDIESLRISSRLNEFIAPLLLEGNHGLSEYIPGSLRTMTDAYNLSSNNKITRKELAILPYLLKGHLLKNYIIKKIRRNEKDDLFDTTTFANLKKIDEEIK
jgi:Ser/Thr protein kinase RdoA (MazF antagonist)